ncbi:MAG: class I SAM-dependent methyltransferase [Pseudomonadota bacterium]
MQQESGHVYSSLFFDYTDAGARRSAEYFVKTLFPVLSVSSVADFGCGRGTWLREWQLAGVETIVGIDGDYVERSELKIAESQFHAHDITQSIDLGQRFDLVQSLEVAEHLPEDAAEQFVTTLTEHGNRILFSAAVPGQGGEFHVNEQPLDYWREKFAARGYMPYDFVRPILAKETEVEPWYRFNSIMYVNDEGAANLPEIIKATRVEGGAPFSDYSDLAWKLRRAVVGRLPQSTINRISQVRAEMIARRARSRAARQTS